MLASNIKESLKSLCPLEKNCNWEFLYFTKGTHPNLPIYICKTCGLQAQYPRPEAHTLYNESYYTGKADYTYVDERELLPFFAHVWDARLKTIQKYKPSGHFLDIGSSFGGFLTRARVFGFSVQGVEVSDFASNYARTQGIPTFTGDLISAKFPSASFDVITLIEVIEHLENPVEIFKELGRILKPGGLLVLQTANFEGWQAIEAGESYHYYLPGHLFYYSHSNLVAILSQNGFSAFRPFFGVDFPLLAKLKKARGSFKKGRDYLRWLRISYYHFLSLLKKDGKPRTSSYVLYAFKK